MRIALIADTFPPLRTSGAVQLRDLVREFARQGHLLTVILPDSTLQSPWMIQGFEGVQVLRLRAPKTKDLDYVRRTINEFLMPFAMRRNLRASPKATQRWDGVIWYAPSIFHGPLAKALKQGSDCRGYLIIRDIFPEWARDVGLIGPGLAYRFFSAVARYQYSVADVIGVQTPGNRKYFAEWEKQPGRKLEVLQNWLGQARPVQCSIQIKQTRLANRKILVYAGNMGVAQGIEALFPLIRAMRHRADVGFLFVGRGSEALRLKRLASSDGLDNALFIDEIHPDEIPSLYAQCHAGIVALDPRHRSHNIPGKFLTYMQAGLPVLANINPGNDLAEMIRTERVGQVCESGRPADLTALTERLLIDEEHDKGLPERCRRLFEREFSVSRTVRQLVAALAPQSVK
jgi:glycosyltransferase involved in cell wall biosynthesis